MLFLSLYREHVQREELDIFHIPQFFLFFYKHKVADKDPTKIYITTWGGGGV